jgi:hypothetical protein
MRLIRAELLKVRTTRLWIGLLLGGLGLTVLGTILILWLTGTAEGREAGLELPRTADDLRAFAVEAADVLAFVLVLATTMATSEFRYGTAAGAYLATPQRWRVVSAKVLAAIPVGFLFGAAAAIVALLIAIAWLAARHLGVPVGGDSFLAIAQVGGHAAYAAVIGVCVGALLRSQLVSILGLIGWVLLIEPLATAFLPRLAKWTPFAGVEQLFGSGPNASIGNGEPAMAPVFDRPGAAALAVAYIVLLWLSAVWAERVRDV